MITLSTQDKTKLEAALARAEAAELKLTVLYQSSVGAHYVVDSDHSRHHVYIWLEGDKAAYECDCQGHGKGLVCRCAAASLKEFRVWLEAQKPLPPAPLCSDCESGEAFAYVDGNWYCLLCIAAREVLENQPELFTCLGQGCRNELTEPDCLCEECAAKLDQEEYLFVEVLQPKYQRESVAKAAADLFGF